MIDHIGVAVSDVDRSRAFYEAALAPLGVRTIRVETNTLNNTAILMGDGDIFLVLADGEPVSDATHIALRARSADEVDAFHVAALMAGGADNGKPGLRPHYSGQYYAAFALDPDGMNLEAVCHLERQ